MSLKTPHRSGAPLMELLLSVCIFALAAVILLQLFLAADSLSRLSYDKSQAGLIAQSTAETVLAKGEELSALEALGFARTAPGQYTARFSQDWKPVSEADLSVFTAVLTVSAQAEEEGTLLTGSVSIAKDAAYPFLSAERSRLIRLPVSAFLSGKEGAE